MYFAYAVLQPLLGIRLYSQGLGGSIIHTGVTTAVVYLLLLHVAKNYIKNGAAILLTYDSSICILLEFTRRI